MASKELRIITAKADIASAVDRGANVDTAVKILTARDKELKAKITGYVDGKLKEGEISVRLAGDKSTAVVTAAESYKMDASSPRYGGVCVAITAGLLSDIVECKRELAVPQADIDKAVDLLKKAGISALIKEEFSLSPEAYRAMSDSDVSQNVANAREALRGCTNKSVVFKVKYEKVGK